MKSLKLDVCEQGYLRDPVAGLFSAIQLIKSWSEEILSIMCHGGYSERMFV